ncbi:neuraminidase-like domain-containing protein [Streptomyces sp. L7]
MLTSRATTASKTPEIDGNGSYLIPAIVQGRPVVFCPVFLKKTVPGPLKVNESFQQAANSKVSDAQLHYYWEIKLAWSEHRNGKWSQKQVTTGAVHQAAAAALPDISGYEFIPRLTDTDPRLTIDVYDAGGSRLGAFAFDGSHLYATERPPASSGISATQFHYRDHRLHSLQAEGTQTPPLADQAPYFENSAAGRVDFRRARRNEGHRPTTPSSTSCSAGWPPATCRACTTTTWPIWTRQCRTWPSGG